MVLAASVAQEVVNVPFAHEVAGFMQPATEAQNVLGMIQLCLAHQYRSACHYHRNV